MDSAQMCPRCGAPIAAGASWCAACGLQRVAQGVAPAPGMAPSAAQPDYTKPWYLQQGNAQPAYTPPGSTMPYGAAGRSD